MFGKKMIAFCFLFGFERRSLFRSRGTKSFATDNAVSGSESTRCRVANLK